MESENDFDLTRCEIVLHEFNKATIDSFLQVHGFETAGQDWGRKTKVSADDNRRNSDGDQEGKIYKKIALSASKQ